jgi:hypothetical protein
MITQNFLTVTILWSLVLMVGLTQPWLLDWSNYTMAWSWVMWVSWLLWMVIITWQVLLGIRIWWWVKQVDAHWLQKLHGYLWLWTIMALIFHPLAVMIAYGTSAFYLFDLDFSSMHEWWISVWKISFDLMIVGVIIYLISRKLLSYPWNTWLHLLMYPIFIGIWWHAWFSGSMIAELPGVRWYWIALGIVLVGSSLIKLTYEIVYRILKKVNQEQTIIHFSPLFL